MPAEPVKKATGRRRGHRVEKLLPVLLLRERFVHICLTNHQGPRSSASSRHMFITASDGFVGSELNIQHTASQHRLRNSNRTSTKKKSTYSNSKNELVLACGYLPAPLEEHKHNDLVRTGSQLHAVGSWAAGTAMFSDGSQSAIAEIAMVTTGKEARRYLRSRTQHYDDLVRNQLSNVTVPIGNLPENSCFVSADNVDEAVTNDYIARLEVDHPNEQFIPH